MLFSAQTTVLRASSPDLRAQCTASSRDGKVEGLCRSTFTMCGSDDMAVPSTTSITTRPCKLAISCTSTLSLHKGQEADSAVFSSVSCQLGCLLQLTTWLAGLCLSLQACQKLKNTACDKDNVICVVHHNRANIALFAPPSSSR